MKTHKRRPGTMAQAYKEMIEYGMLAALDTMPEGATLTLKQFATYMGLVPGTSLRSALGELVERGILRAMLQAGDRLGGQALHYFKPTEVVKPLPFDDSEVEYHEA
jgi:hypothetical protein